MATSKIDVQVLEMLGSLMTRLERLEGGSVQQVTTAPAQTVQPQTVVRVAKARTAQQVSWFIGDRAHKAGELMVAGQEVLANTARTQFLSINTGFGQYGQEVVYVPQNGTMTAVLDALHTGAPIQIRIGNAVLDLVRKV